MAASGMCKLASTKVASSDAFDRNHSILRPASTHGRPNNSDPVWADRGVLRVLVVNDQQDAADELVRQVRRWGHAAHMASDGYAALRMAATHRPHVVLLNLELPFIDGCQVASQLRRDFPRKERFIIAVTERADDERRQQCIEAGIDLLLIEPVDPSVLETLLLLECELVSRSPTNGAVGRPRRGSSRFAREEPSTDEREVWEQISTSAEVDGRGAVSQVSHARSS